MSEDPAAIEAVLADDVRALSDGGGEFHAARVPILGRARVARFYANIAARRREGAHTAFVTLNGLPALAVEMPTRREGEAPRFVLSCDVDEEGRVTALHAILASAKLVAVRFPPEAG